MLILGLSLSVFAQTPAVQGRVATPTCTPGTGVYSNNKNVSCTIANGATGCFTTSGIPPTAPTPGTCGPGSSIYSGPLLLDVTNTKLEILATESGLTNSLISSYTYTFKAAAPTASPVAGTYAGAQSVTLSSASTGASIYYSATGTATCSSELYTGPIPVAAAETIKAVACETGYSPSTIASFNYRINYTLTQAISGTGTVVSKPVGISCPSTCSATFGTGTVIKLTETPGAGYTFGGWSGGGCSGSASTCTVTMNAAQSVTATFLPNETLMQTIVGIGSVSSSPSGISCPSACSATFTYNTPIRLTETPATGYTFGGWSGGGCSGSASTCVVSMNSAQSVTATFLPNETLTQTIVGTGSVSSSPSGISCPSSCSASFTYNTSVMLTATAGTGYTFTSWSGGGCSGSASTCVVPMNSAQSVTATFL
ncbi:MAG: chitobiase/beta-hexosaminidase C-terminal domain-containing protein, partial [Candidatus Sulfotelmatobacter sp.]